jgi:methyltransferase
VVGYVALVAAVGAERLVELAIAARNRRWALERGAVEAGAGHYPWIVALHVAFLAACPVEVWLLARPLVPALAWTMGGALAAAMALRYWAIAALGRRWNTRILVVPGEPAVVAGPYRFVRHPNYLAIVVEMVALPMIHTAWLTALTASALGALLLRVRIRAEEAALAAHADYARRLGDRPALLPGTAGRPR